MEGPTGSDRTGPDPTVAGTTGTRASVRTDVLGLRFRDRDGGTVLESVPAGAPAPAVRWPLPDRLPLGTRGPRSRPLAAPVTFVVGRSVTAQLRATPWIGDLWLEALGGIEHAATEVLDVDRDGEVVTVRAATTDPRRTVHLRVAPDAAGSFAVTVRVEPSAHVAAVALTFAAPPDEAFHGFGGRRNAIDQRGTVFSNWAESFAQAPQPFDVLERLPWAEPRWQFPTGAHGTYYPQPLLISSEGYGFLVDRFERSTFRLAQGGAPHWQVGIACDRLDVVVAPGDGPTAIGALTAITGRHRVPPAWSLGPMLSRAIETLSGTPEGYAAHVEADLAAIADHDLPITAYAFEGWPMLDQLGRMDEVVARLRRRGIKPLVYLKSFIGGGAGTEELGLYEEAIERGFVATTRRGHPYRFGSPVAPNELAVLLDVTHPDAVAWWQGRVRAVLDRGADGFMQDFGEHVMAGMRFHDGSTGAQLHNRYPVLYHRATREALDAYVADHPDREPWFFVRSGYTGRPGSAAYENASWGGDVTTDWSRASGIGSVVPDLLNRGVGGAYGYATDIGGYIDTFGGPDAELLTRWAQLGALLPVNRLHGSPIRGTHMPWRYGDEVLTRYRATIELHRRAHPLLLELWRHAARSGLPICRPLWLEHPQLPGAHQADQQWLLGPDVLVAPVVERGATSREVLVPPGAWEHPESGHVVNGPGAVVVPAPLDLLPYYVRRGTDPFGDAAARARGGR